MGYTSVMGVHGRFFYGGVGKNNLDFSEGQIFKNSLKGIQNTKKAQIITNFEIIRANASIDPLCRRPSRPSTF